MENRLAAAQIAQEERLASAQKASKTDLQEFQKAFKADLLESQKAFRIDNEVHRKSIVNELTWNVIVALGGAFTVLWVVTANFQILNTSTKSANKKPEG
jgi:predicted DNA repair protein MutK